VICAALWPDPADPLCPESFKAEAKKQMAQFWNLMDTSARNVDDPLELRKALLDFIADFSNWDNSTKEQYLTTARKLTQSAHEALGGEPGTRPLVVDPFAGGGSIPLEALRVGADAYASDLNPVAVLLNKVVLEYIPKYGPELATEVRKWGQWVKEETEKELSEYYPKDPDGATPIAYLWARTVRCEGPGCGAEVPLIRSLWLAKKTNLSFALKLIPNPIEKRVDFDIICDAKPADVQEGTVKRGSATCPCCGYTTPVTSVRKQLKIRHGGADDARMFCVVTTKSSEQGRFYRLPIQRDFDAVRRANEKLVCWKKEWNGEMCLVPDESLPQKGALGFRVQGYGMVQWENLFSSRQILTISTITKMITCLSNERNSIKPDHLIPIQTCLAFVLDRQANTLTSLSRWHITGQKIEGLYSRQAIPMIWDFCEANPFSNSTGSYDGALDWVCDVIENISKSISKDVDGIVEQNDAASSKLPSDSANALITDPPYYDAIPYSDLSDFFYVWLKRSIGKNYPVLFHEGLTPKKDECIVDETKGKDKQYFEKTMQLSMSEGRRILIPQGIGVVVFANKSTSGWEAQLQAMVDSDWTVTGSWPIDTEMGSRLRAMDSAALASSIHLVCRPRENMDGTPQEIIGEWSDVLTELPFRIREWMPRLKQENVVGADAIFACLGPALEIFSRYSRVEKASGDKVSLKEYLEKVWEAVEKEALTMIFEGADASGFEEDARLTAMWLWTMKAGTNGESSSPMDANEAETEDDANETLPSKPVKIAGYGLEYDAARKISQGLGAHPEDMPTLIEIKKGNARLLSVAERAPFLFGKQELAPKRKTKKRDAQLTLFPGEAVAEESAGYGSLGELSAVGKTNLDRVHQSMLLFGNGKSEELKRFLVEDGVGKDQQFKKLAQALVALYPTGSDEKRWAEGVMSRMKGLGL
jgi:adenine-specific DNA methylase